MCPPNAGLNLYQRLRRWPNSKPALGQRLLFAEMYVPLSCDVCSLTISGKRAPRFILPSLIPVVARNSTYRVRIQVVSEVCHRCYAYTVLQTIRRYGVCTTVCYTVHYEEPLTQ